MLKRKQKGFALVFVVIALAIILGIFFNYSMTARARKGYVGVMKASSNLENSVNKALSAGIYDAYLIDQMIAKNQDAVQDYLGYFIVKDIAANTGNVSQGDAIKIWEKNSGAAEGPWYKIRRVNSNNGEYVPKYNTYAGGTWTFTSTPADKAKSYSKGGYQIVYIKNMLEPNNIDTDTANDVYLYGSNATGFTEEYVNNYTGNRDYIAETLKQMYDDGRTNAYPKFEMMLYKNILFETGSKKVGSFDVYAKLELNYPQIKTDPNTSNASRKPFDMKANLIGNLPPVVPGLSNIIYGPETTVETGIPNEEFEIFDNGVYGAANNYANVAWSLDSSKSPNPKIEDKFTKKYVEDNPPGFKIDSSSTINGTVQIGNSCSKNPDAGSINITSVPKLDSDGNQVYEPSTNQPIMIFTKIERVPYQTISLQGKYNRYTKTQWSYEQIKNNEYQKSTSYSVGIEAISGKEIVKTCKIDVTKTVVEATQSVFGNSQVLSYEINHLGPQ